MSVEDERRRRSERGHKHNERGRRFHLGMAEARGETRESGWRYEATVKLGNNRERRHDTARMNERGGLDFTEYKGGNLVGGDTTREQLAKDREILERDINARGSWVLVQGSASRDFRQQLEAMERDFGERFRVVEVSKAQAREARLAGRRIERERELAQPELFDSKVLRAEQRMRERAERLREKIRVQEAAQRAIEQQRLEREAQEREREFRARREAAERLAERMREEREAVARGGNPEMTGMEAKDFLALSGPPPGTHGPGHEAPQVTRGGSGRGQERGRDQYRDR
ncbi:MAG: hypothetical protein HOQ36_10485 [Nocardia sp.]|nr:hypothetical protein [Nocardia sp.]NUS92824.1 hypothetical protein [Nocardia sp.]